MRFPMAGPLTGTYGFDRDHEGDEDNGDD